MATSSDDTMLESDVEQKEQETEEIVEADTPKLKAPSSSRITMTTKPGDPPRRTLTAGAPKRPTSTSTVATTKPTVASVRSSAGSTISKPPTRPPVTLASARRPLVSSTTLTDRSRATVGPSAAVNKDASTTDEPRRTMAAGTARRASLVSSLASKESAPSTGPTVRRTLAASADKKPSTLSNGTTPMAKRSTITTPRTVRSSTITSNSSRPGTALEGRKRLSTIPASPAVQASPTATKTPRPGLGKRSSTMSVNLQQKLKEMELVHQMLRVAMAQDGDEDDELKAEYTQQMDQKITELRSQLEQSGAASSLASEDAIGKASIQPIEDQPKTHSDEADDKVVALEAELADLKKEWAIQQTKQTTRSRTGDTSEDQSEFDEKTSDLHAEHAAEISRLRDEAEAAEQTLQKEKLKLQQDHDAEIAKFKEAISAMAALYQQQLAQSTKDFEDQKLAALRRAQQESYETAKTQRSALETEVSSLQEKLKTGEEQHLSTVARLEEVSKSLAAVQDQLVSSQKQAAENASFKDEHVKSVEDKQNELSQLSTRLETAEAKHLMASNRISELEAELVGLAAAKELAAKLQDVMNAKESDISNLQQRADTLTKQSETKIKELEETAAMRAHDFEALQTKVKDLEAAASASDAQQKEASNSKDQELLVLQERINQMAADKTAWEDQKSNLSAEKDAEIAILHKKIADTEQNSSAEVAVLIAAKDAELQQLEKRLADMDDNNRAALAERTESSAAKDEEISKLQAKVTDLEKATGQATSEREFVKTSLEEELAQVRTQLEIEKQAVQDAKDEAARLASEMSLRHDRETKELAETNNRIAEDRDSLKTRVEEISAQAINADSLRKQVDELVQALQASEAMVESSKIQSQKEHVSRLDELQKQHESTLSSNYDEYQSSLSRLEDELAILKQERDTRIDAFNSLQQEVTDAEVKLKEADRQALESREDKSKLQQALSQIGDLQKALHEKAEELETVLSKQAQTVTDVKEEHAAAVGELQSRHKNDLESLQTAHAVQIRGLTTKHSSDQTEWERTHADALTQLQAQLEQSAASAISAKISMEESHSTTVRELTAGHTAKVEELRQQLSQAESDLATAQSDLERTKKASDDLESLKEQHAAQIAEQQTLQHELKVRVAELSGQLNTVENDSNVQKQSHQAEKLDLSWKLDNLLAAHDASAMTHETQIAKMAADHEAQITALQAQHQAAVEDHEKQRKAGAQVRDNLASQLENLESARQLVPVLEEKTIDLQRQCEASEERILHLQIELGTAEGIFKEERVRNEALKEELEALHHLIKKNIDARQQDDSEVVAAQESLKALLQDEQVENATLRKQLDSATYNVQYQAALVKETEAALKAASAEITALKTQVRGPKTPTLAGLSGSRWASDGDAGSQTKEDVDEGAETQGALASIHAQLQTLRDINDSMMNNHSRMITYAENGSADPESPQAKDSPVTATPPSLSAAAPEFVPGRS